ncbi:MAG: methyl-accepting chemotaxis protein [Nitrospirota bacterium]|jgi:methyl-accepting chemotaxis protein
MMTWFGNMKTMWKLILGFALTGVLVIIMGGILAQGILSIRDQLRVVYEDYTVAGTDLASVANNLNRTRTNDFVALDASTIEEYRQIVSRDAEVTESVKKPLEAYAVTVLRISKSGRDEAKDLQKFRDAYAAYVESSNLVYETLKQAWSAPTKSEMEALRAKAHTISSSNSGPKMEATIVALNELLATVKEVAKDMNDAGIGTVSSSLSTLIVGSTTVIVLGVFIGWLIARFLSRNLADVVKVAQAIGGGDLKARSSVATQDEVGSLAQAFNTMGENLQASIAKQQEAATAMQELSAKTALERDVFNDELKAREDIINLTSIVSEADLKGDIVSVNDKFCEISKYSKDELIGKPHSLLRHPDMPKETFKALWATIGRGQIFHGVIKNRAKDGTPYYVDAVIKPILGKNGKPCKYVGVRYDITQVELARQNMKGIVDAIDKSYATIEFDLKGNIQTANNVFLQTMGYSLDEIKGKHHSMFVEPSYSGTSEYRSFWEKLGHGEYDAGQYKRIGKGGKEIWLQASYNPIMDEMGRPFKVVKFATDITGQKQAQVEVEKLIVAAAAGQLTERINTDRVEGASKALTQSFNQLLDAVATPLHEAQNVLTALAANDLTKTMTGAYQGEFAQMKDSLNAAITNLTETLSTVREAAESVSTGTEQITKGSEDLSQRTSEQASALEETSASMEEMTSTVKQNADNAKQANQLAIAARDIANKGGAITTKAVEAMGEINKSSKKIADIITVIDEIAFQTNLLALNAAVEAARAGEHGRGFAVVAAEVRNLAQRSATAAKEIKGLINESVQRVTDGSELVTQSGKTLEEIVSSVKRVTDIIAEITAASQEQATGIDQTNKVIMQMDEMTQQNAALVEEATSASQSMNEQAQALMRQVGSFKMTGSRQESHARSSAAPAAHKPSALSAGPVKKPLFKKPAAPSKAEADQKLAGVAAGNGKDRRQKDSEFEEF